ncbi:MAG: hypothetical protein JF593_13805 [Novosphingobium sp.]|nr:hypothetical protein [Novosphingobium sp.]
MLLSACSGKAPDAPAAPAAHVETVACALGGATQFKPECTVEHAIVDGKHTLIVRQPSGSFRRFAVLADGRGLALADGAEAARRQLAGNLLEVAIGSDRYRFPVTVRAHASP